MNRKKIALLSLAAVTAALAQTVSTKLDKNGHAMPVTQAAKKPLKIAVIGLENNPFWTPVKEGAQAANAELKKLNARVDWIVPAQDFDARAFGQAIQTAVTQQYDAIATIAPNEGVIPFIDAAVKAGVPVATFNSETNGKSARLFFVGQDLFAAGKVAGQTMCKAIGNKGKVGVITGFLTVEAHELRRTGFLEGLKACPAVKVVGTTENHDQGTEAYTIAKNYLTANPDLAGIYVTAGGPFGAGQAVRESKKNVKVVSFDFVDETMREVSQGGIYATIGQDPYAQGHDPAIRLYNLLVADVKPESAKLFTKADVVTKANLSSFWKPKQ